METPLLSSGHVTEKSDKGSERWSTYEHVGRAGSAIPTAFTAGTEVSVDEIRSAAAFSEPYPPSLHAPLVGSSEPHHFFPNGEGAECDCKPTRNRTYVLGFRSDRYNFVHFGVIKWWIRSIDAAQVTGYPQGGYHGHVGTTSDVGRQVLDEVEIRELLIDHVGHRCCWGSRPARTWNIHAVEDCNVYTGTLETFIEERETITEKEPYSGGNIDGKHEGPELGMWELDLRSEFPVLFTPHKESRTKIPHSEAIEKCSGCAGRGKFVCPTCNKDQEPGFYKENQMSPCPACYGRGLIAHRDGSDTVCLKCNGKGTIPCATCGSRGFIKCEACQGGGSLLTRQVAVIRWKTLSARKVSATSGAASVPDDVFHRAKGVQLCNNQAYQCTPAFFADSYLLNKFSSEVIAERAPVPPTARIICERHTISVVPVTRVTLTHRSRSFSFYLIGTGREVYLKESYPSRFCWGLCPCLEWLKL